MHTVFYLWVDKDYYGTPNQLRWCLATLGYNWEAGETIPELAERIWNIAAAENAKGAIYVEPRVYKLF